jgi:sugar lactone lactonase YvrE
VTLVARHLLRLQTELGECPVWDHRTGTLYLVDIIRCRIIARDWASGGVVDWPLPSLGGGLALASRGRLVVGCQTGIFLFDPANGSYEFLTDPERDRPTVRLNEGKVDPQGRLWIGSMSTLGREPVGRLHCIRPDGRASVVLSGIVIPNTLCWLPGGTEALFADSWARRVMRYRYEPEMPSLLDPTIHVDLSDQPGIPDGVAEDREGGVWVAQFGAGLVRHVARDGSIDEVVELPVTQVTSCVLAGPAMDKLVIVTTKRLLDLDARDRQPTAGDLYVVEGVTPGMAASVFG